MKARCAHGAPWWREDCPGCRYVEFEASPSGRGGPNWKHFLDLPEEWGRILPEEPP